MRCLTDCRAVVIECRNASSNNSSECANRRNSATRNEREPADEEESEAEDELNEEERRIANQIKASLAARGDA